MGSLGGSAGQQPPPEQDDSAPWHIVWCYDGWHHLRRQLQALLPPWAKLRLLTTSRPLEEQVADASVLIPTTGHVDAAAIAAAPRLQAIVQPASSVAWIDVEAARARGIPVTNAPGLNDAATAELTVMLMLMLVRRVDEARAAFDARGVVGEPAGRGLGGKTLGVVGMGRIGRRVAAAAAALGMRVVSTNSSSSREQLDALLSEAHVVSLHCQLTALTTGLIGARELSLVRPGAVLINTARARVVDKDALLHALESGRLAGAGLDVHWVEPADPEDRLYRHPNVIALPHVGTATEESFDDLARLLCHNIIAMREGRQHELLHRVV